MSPKGRWTQAWRAVAPAKRDKRKAVLQISPSVNNELLRNFAEGGTTIDVCFRDT